MDYLLDTHVCLWAITEQNKLSQRVKNILQKENNNFFVSKISFFEIAIKLKIGKFQEFKIPLAKFIASVYLSSYQVLPVKDIHFKSYLDIDFNESHRDPFDRYLLAVAHSENLAIITKDEKFQFYKQNYQIIW